MTSGTCIFDNGHVQPIDFLKTGQNTSAIHKYARLRLVPVRDEMQSHSTVVYTAKSWLMRFCLCPRRLCGIMFSPYVVPLSRRLPRASIGSPASQPWPARYPCGEVHSCADMDSPADEYKRNRLQGRQVHYTDSALPCCGRMK